MTKTRIGVVDYLNAQPLIEGLESDRNAKIIRDTPSRLSDMLQVGKLDVALVSSVECFRHPEFRILPEVGVCSEGAVRSVKLYSHNAPEKAQRIALDRSSRSASTLTKVVYLEFFQQTEVEFITAEPTTRPSEVDADAVLLIGDAALQADPEDMTVTDLGALWTERTGLPFVYAVWACREGTNVERLLPTLLKARDRGLPLRPRLAQDAAKKMKLPVAALTQYLTKNLRYELGEREIKGLERFRDLAAEHELCSKHDVPFVGARVQPV